MRFGCGKTPHLRAQDADRIQVGKKGRKPGLATSPHDTNSLLSGCCNPNSGMLRQPDNTKPRQLPVCTADHRHCPRSLCNKPLITCQSAALRGFTSLIWDRNIICLWALKDLPYFSFLVPYLPEPRLCARSTYPLGNNTSPLRAQPLVFVCVFF